MTELAKLVIVTKGTQDWSYSRVAEMAEQFTTPDEDPARQLKRQRIIRAATELIAQHGYRKVSVDEIARRAQVAKGTIYLYYKNKAELLVHAIVEEKKRYIVRIKPVLDGSLPPRECIKEFIRLTLTLVSEMPMLSKLLQGDREVLLVMEEMDTNLREEIIAERQHFFRHLIQAAAPGVFSEDEERDRARLLASLIYSGGAFFDERVRHGLSIERFAEVLADVIVDGLANPPAAPQTTENMESA